MDVLCVCSMSTVRSDALPHAYAGLGCKLRFRNVPVIEMRSVVPQYPGCCILFEVFFHSPVIPVGQSYYVMVIILTICFPCTEFFP